MSVTVLYEDAECLVVRKPVGMPTQPDLTEDTDLLTVAQEQQSVPLHPVHRLDRAVSGPVLFAKGARAAARLSEDIREGRMGKEYLAVCEGALPPEGEMRDLLYHDKRRGKAFTVDRSRRGVKEARLRYRVLARRSTDSGELQLVHVLLDTGRFHQIRVQFASRGCPLYGDGKYGSRRKGPIGLCAIRLSFESAHGPMTVCAEAPSTLPFHLFPERSPST